MLQNMLHLEVKMAGVAREGLEPPSTMWQMYNVARSKWLALPARGWNHHLQCGRCTTWQGQNGWRCPRGVGTTIYNVADVQRGKVKMAGVAREGLERSLIGWDTNKRAGQNGWRCPRGVGTCQRRLQKA